VIERSQPTGLIADKKGNRTKVAAKIKEVMDKPARDRVKATRPVAATT